MAVEAECKVFFVSLAAIIFVVEKKTAWNFALTAFDWL
jgi:hypothetical protein